MGKMISLLLVFLLSVILSLGAMSCKKKEEAPSTKAPAVEEKVAPVKEAPAEEKVAPAEKAPVPEKAAPAEEISEKGKPAPPEKVPSGETPSKTTPEEEEKFIPIEGC